MKVHGKRFWRLNLLVGFCHLLEWVLPIHVPPSKMEPAVLVHVVICILCEQILDWNALVIGTLITPEKITIG